MILKYMPRIIGKCMGIKKNGQRCTNNASTTYDLGNYCKIHQNLVNSHRLIGNTNRDIESREFILCFELSDDAKCSICLDSLSYDGHRRICQTLCAHNFHLECVNGWLNRHESCPMCRFEQDEDDLIMLCKPQNNKLTDKLLENCKKIIMIGNIEKMEILDEIFNSLLISQ